MINQALRHLLPTSRSTLLPTAFHYQRLVKPSQTASEMQPQSSHVSTNANNHTAPYFTSTLVSPATLHTALESHPPTAQSTHRLIPLSAAWFLPNDPQSRTGASSYAAHRIPHSSFFDLEAISDCTSPYPHMLPSPSAFAAAMGNLCIERSDTLVVYDTPELGLFSAPRVAWTLRVFGHKRVHVLDNFKLWVESGKYPVESGQVHKASDQEPRNYEFEGEHEDVMEKTVAAMAGVREVVESKGGKDGHSNQETIIVDARPRARWEGTAPEPRPGLESGHMPGSVSIPFTEVLDPATKTMLSREKLRTLFEERLGGVQPRKIISTCGTGVTAAAVDLALAEAGMLEGEEFGHGRRMVYDGSWTEWATEMKGRGDMIAKA